MKRNSDEIGQATNASDGQNSFAVSSLQEGEGDGHEEDTGNGHRPFASPSPNIRLA